jgi:hypothetical protein
MDDFDFDEPDGFAGQLQRGRGIAVHRTVAATDAAEAVYRCVIEDSRWDRQVDDRAAYLTGWIARLGLPLTPLEQHLYAATDAEALWLSMEVMGRLGFDGYEDAVDALRRYALDGLFWSEAVDTIGWSGSWERPGALEGLADGLVGRHDDTELAAAVGDYEPWLSLARTQPRIAELVDERRASRRSVTRPSFAAYDADTLLRHVYASDVLQRRRVLLELGDRGDLRLLDLAADRTLRNSAGRTPGMASALERLGVRAVDAARRWVDGDDATLTELGIRVLSTHGAVQDGPVLLAAVVNAVDDGAWCALERPARGLGRIGYHAATEVLRHAWDVTIHSTSRHDLLDGLAGCAPEIAVRLAADEAFEDCEHAVRETAGTLAGGRVSRVRREVSRWPR